MPVHDAKKLTEADARLLALRIAASFPGHEAATSEIKDLVPRFYHLSKADLKPSKTRPNESLWRQIIGNAVGSHQSSGPSIFSDGYAVKTHNGIRVTKDGLDYLKSLGY